MLFAKIKKIYILEQFLQWNCMIMDLIFQQNLFRLLTQTQNWNIFSVQKALIFLKEKINQLTLIFRLFFSFDKVYQQIDCLIPKLQIAGPTCFSQQKNFLELNFDQIIYRLLKVENQKLKTEFPSIDSQGQGQIIKNKNNISLSNICYQQTCKHFCGIDCELAFTSPGPYYIFDAEFLLNIFSIDFQNLKIISLPYSQIDNIESFQFLNAPKLQRVILRFNKITIISPWLQKIKYPQLKYLCVSSNKMKQINLGRLFSHKNIELEIFESRTKSSPENINYLAKINSLAQLQPQSLKNYVNISTDRERKITKEIPQSKCVDVLTRKRIISYS